MFLCLRPYWRCYFPNTQAIIYVVDSSDTDRLVIAKDEFHAILEVHFTDLTIGLKKLMGNILVLYDHPTIYIVHVLLIYIIYKHIYISC